MMKKLINDFFNMMGYHIIRKPSVESDIKSGKFKWLEIVDIKTVIDVGANDGGFALMINKVLPDAFIYSFEPIKSIFENLKSNTSQISNKKLFNAALGEKQSEELFYINDFSPSSSFLKIKEKHIQSFPYTAKQKMETVKVAKLDSFAESMVLKPNIMLKLDVQGYELKVLAGAAEILNQVTIILIEVSFVELYNSQPLFDQVYKYLNNRGFRYSGNLDQLCDPVTNQVLQADAIFIRDAYD